MTGRRNTVVAPGGTRPRRVWRTRRAGSVRIGLLTEGGYPYARGEGSAWCERLVSGLPRHEFDVYALSRSARTEAAGLVRTPPHVCRVRQKRLWGAPAGEPFRGGRAARGAFREGFREFAGALAGGGTERRADRFACGLYALADLAQECPGALPALLRGDEALGELEAACRAPGVRPVLADIVVTELLAVVDELERVLRPLSARWYGPAELGAVDVCHAVSGGPAALPGLL